MNGAVKLRTDPRLFGKLVLGVDLWPTQQEILWAIARHRRVAVKACHASGKTYAIAVAVLWWIINHPDGIAVTTAPTWVQVEKLIWGEIRQLILRARATGKILLPVPNKTELTLGPGNYALGLSTDESMRFQGFHAGKVLVVLDEAPGVRDEIYQAVEGISAGGDVHVLALGNPVCAGGPFYSAFTSDRARWKTITIDAFNTPNLQGLSLEQLRTLPPDLPENQALLTHALRPYLITRRWVYEAFFKYGESSPFWQARVRGEFPTQAEDALLSLAWLEAAAKRAAKDDGSALKAGIDVAGPGEDETVAVIRCGSSIIAQHAWPDQDPRGEVLAFLAPYKNRLVEVNVDSAGIGYGFALHLDDHGYPVNFVNVGEATHDPERYFLLKGQLYWALRQRFQDGDVAGLTDQLTISQLATLRYRHSARGQIVIESKEEMKKRGVKSPDRAEAVMLAFADRTPGIIEYYRERAEALAKACGDLSKIKQPSEDDNEPFRIYEDERRRLEQERHQSATQPSSQSTLNSIGVSSDSGWTPPGFKR